MINFSGWAHNRFGIYLLKQSIVFKNFKMQNFGEKGSVFREIFSSENADLLFVRIRG